MARIGENRRYGTIGYIELNGSGAGGYGAGGAGGAGGEDNGHTGPFSAQWGGIGDPRNTVVRNWENEGRRGQAFDTREGQNEKVGEIYREGTGQRERARSAEQQLGNYAYYDWNLAQNNPRGNLNQKSYDTTLMMSRLADSVNNRLHWNPGTASTIMTRNGPQTLGQGTGDVEKWEPIETQEMRQMRANERLDERAREAGVDLQSRIQAYPQEIQEQMDENARKLRYYMNQMDDDYISWLQKELINTEYKGSWENFFNEKFNEYLMELNLEKSDRIYQMLRRLTPAHAMQAAYAYGLPNYTPMNIREYILNEFYENLRAQGVSPEVLLRIEDQMWYALERMMRPYNNEQITQGIVDAYSIGGSRSRSRSSEAQDTIARRNNALNTVYGR